VTGLVQAAIQALADEVDQGRGRQVVEVHGFGVVAHLGGVAHDHEKVAQTEGVGRQQIALHAQQVAAAGGEVQHGLHA